MPKHYSSNGKVPLENNQRVFAGFMDNDVSLFGKKFFDRSYIDLSANFLQKVRYAYGYNTEVPFEFNKKDIKLNYYDVGGNFSLHPLTLTQLTFLMILDLSYDYFPQFKRRKYESYGFFRKNVKAYQGFYVGSGLKIDHYRLSESIDLKPKYILSLNPYVRKSTDQWNFNLGVSLSVEQEP